MTSKDEMVPPEQILKGVLNTLMQAVPKTTVALTPRRQAPPTSAFSTPSRSVSSIHDDDDVADDYRSSHYAPPLQPHLEMEAEEGWKATAGEEAAQGVVVAAEEENKHSAGEGDSRVTEDSPRSALDGIPFTTSPSEAPVRVTQWNAKSSPGRDDTSTLGFSSFMSKDASPQRFVQSSSNGSLFSTPPRPQTRSTSANQLGSPGGQPPLPPSYHGSPRDHYASSSVDHSKSSQSDDDERKTTVRSPIDQLNEQLLSHAHRIQPSPQPTGLLGDTAVSNCDNKSTLTVSSLLGQDAQNFQRDEEPMEASAPSDPQNQNNGTSMTVSSHLKRETQQIQQIEQPTEMSRVTSVASSHHNDTTVIASNLFGQDSSQDTFCLQNNSDIASPERSFTKSSASTPQAWPSSPPRDAHPKQSPQGGHHSGQSEQSSGSQGSRHSSPRQSPNHDSQQCARQSPRLDFQPDRPQHLDHAQPSRRPLPRHSPQPSPRQSSILEQQSRESPQGESTLAKHFSDSNEIPHSNRSQRSDQPDDSKQPPTTSERSEAMPEMGHLQRHEASPFVPSAASTPDRSHHSDLVQPFDKSQQPCQPHSSTQSLAPTPDRSDRADLSQPFDQTAQLQQSQQPQRHRQPSPSTRSANSTPDRSQRSQQTTQASPGSISNGSFARAERFTKAQNFIRRVRGTAVGENDGGIPPKPPAGPSTARPGSPSVLSPSDCTPVVSNQQRKSLSASEEKKESEDWPSSAVKQMTKAVDQLRFFGESFIYDESPSRDSQSQNRLNETHSDASGPWWQKEETFHTDGDDLDYKELAKEIVNEPTQKSQSSAAAASVSIRASPSPPPSILRTPHNPNLVKPVAMELSRTADQILQPGMDDYLPAPEDEDDIVKNGDAKASTTKSDCPVSTGPASVDPSSADSASRAVTPMMRMRVPGAQESVLMGDNEILPSLTEEASVSKTPARAEKKADAESLSPRHGVDFSLDETLKTALTPDRSRRSKSSRSSKGRSRASSTRRCGSGRRRRRRQKEGLFVLPAQCEAGIPIFFQNLIDRQCGHILDDDEGSDNSSYWSGESGDESDGETYGESTYKSELTTPSRKAPFLQKGKDCGKEKTCHTAEEEKRLVDMERDCMSDRDRLGESELADHEPLDHEHLESEKSKLEAGMEPLRAIQKGKGEQQQNQLQQGISDQKTTQPIFDEERSVERVKRRKNDASNIRNKGFIREFISELTTEGIKLMQHRRSQKHAFSRPTEVTAYLQLGIEAGASGFCEPCLQFLADDGIPVVSVDLFDVRSLEKATALQLQAYPLAVPGNSLLIRTNPGDFVFEAKQEQDAMRIVHGMRWLIARLSFNLIIGNANVSCELLDVGRKAFKQRVGDSNRMKAMNDLANHLVDKSSVSSTP